MLWNLCWRLQWEHLHLDYQQQQQPELRTSLDMDGTLDLNHYHLERTTQWITQWSKLFFEKACYLHFLQLNNWKGPASALLIGTNVSFFHFNKPALVQCGSPKGTCIDNAYCQICQCISANYNANITHWKMLTCYLILSTNLHSKS